MARPESSKTVARYLAQVRRRPRLDGDEERRIMRDVADGDRGSLERLVEANLGFVVKIATGYRNLGVPFEDLLNEGNLGLIEAARRFDPERGVKFITYAVWWIRKSILQALGDRSRLVRLPNLQVRRAERVRRSEQRLRSTLGRPPSRSELVRDLGMKDKEIDRLLQLALRPTSIDRPLAEDSSSTPADLLADDAPSSESRILRLETLSNLKRAIDRLKRQQRLVLALRFGLGGEPAMTLQLAGNRLGISRERVRQIEAQAIARLRRELVANQTPKLAASQSRPSSPGGAM